MVAISLVKNLLFVARLTPSTPSRQPAASAKASRVYCTSHGPVLYPRGPLRCNSRTMRGPTFEACCKKRLQTLEDQRRLTNWPNCSLIEPPPTFPTADVRVKIRSLAVLANHHFCHDIVVSWIDQSFRMSFKH